MILESSKKLLMARAGVVAPAGGPELVWDLGDQANYSSVSTISLPGTLQENDTVFVATCSDTATALTPSGYTEIANSTAFSVYYMLSYKVMGATPDSTITGVRSSSTATHTAFAFRGLGSYSADWFNSGTSGAPAPNATPAAGVSSPSGGIIIFVGYLDDQRAFLLQPSGFTLCGRSYSSSKGASIAASYASIPVGAFGGYSGSSDSWTSLVTTFDKA